MENLPSLLIVCLTFGLCQGRVVTVPAGPLTRIEGQPVAVRCDVEQYGGPREQDFEWKVQRGSESLQVISTFDPSYTDRSLRERIDSGDITVYRLADNVVELRIKEARLSDSAIYRCSTPSTDSAFSGNYQADVQLKVITNSLVVAPESPKAVVPEGGSVELPCKVTRDFTEGTYLSVTWSVRKGASLAEELLTFGPDGGVSAGGGAAQRYADGGLRLHLRGGGAYGLVLAGALPVDQGVYVCTAQVWTREAGGVWLKIQEKSVDMGGITITPTAQSLVVTVRENMTANTGDTLTLTCAVSAANRAALGLEVAWLLNGTVVVHAGRDGVVAPNASDAVGVRRVGEGDFRLVLRGVEKSDSGLYSCRVRAWVRHSSGGWYQAAEKTSEAVQVLVTHLEPVYTVTLDAPVTPQFVGDPTELECRVTNISHMRGGRLGVSWVNLGPAGTHTIASLDENGALSAGKKYQSRLEAGLIAATRVEPDTFKLRLLHTTDADEGQYACSIAALMPARHGGWEMKTEYQTPALNVSLANKSPSLSVVARRVREAMAAGATFEMSCQVSGGESLRGASYSVLVKAQEGPRGPSRRVASLDPDAVAQLEEWAEPGRQDSVALAWSAPGDFRFRLQGVQESDRGFYSCEVAAWTRQPGEAWSKAASGGSNKVQIAFEHTGPSFGVAISSDTTSVYPWETAKMECVMSVVGTSPNPDDVAYEMRWYLSRMRGSDSPALLATMDRWGVVRKSPRNDSSDCSLERMGARTFILSVHSTQDSDSGEYHCTATPWLRTPTSGAWGKAPDITSSRIFLNVKFALWDSMKLPLMYGACASLSVGLFSILLGLICAHCCCRNTTHTPRTGNKLLDLEMD